MTHPIPERKQWFRDRIGMILFRNETTCKCGICKNVYENGLHIHDIDQADYAYDCECEYTAEGFPLRYFDTREELNEWLKLATL